MDIRGDLLQMEIQNPHDKFFKEMLGNVETAKDFIANYLPQQLLQVMDIDTLEPQKDTFINKELKENFSDLLYKVDICNQEGYLYLLLEHKSYVDKGIAFQLLKYMIEIWEAKRDKEQEKQLPIVIPLVIYHGRSAWTIPTSLSELLMGYDTLPEDIKGYVPNFEYELFNLSQFSDEEIKGNARTKIAVRLFRDMSTKTGKPLLWSFIQATHYLYELNDQQTALGVMKTMMHYLFSTAKDITQKDVEEMIHQIEMSHIDGGELAMTLADMWREEGMQKGIEQGIEKGIEKGMAIGETKALSNMALIQLTNKFGELPQNVRDAISKANTET